MSSLCDVLVPGEADESLASFADVVVTDSDERVSITGVDQVLAALVRRLVRLGGDQAAVVQLPRGGHETALLLGISSQLLCRRQPSCLAGPVTVIASDVDLIGRLRALGVEARRRMGLRDGNPLNAYRVRRDSTLCPAYGQDAGDIDRALLYLNTRVGWPDLPYASRGVAIIDGISITSSETRATALAWARKHASVVIVIGHLGDNYLVQSVVEQIEDPLVLPLTWSDLSDVADELGTRPASGSRLSSAALLLRSPPQVELHHVAHEEIEEALAAGFAALAQTPDGPFPYAVSRPAALIRAGSRLLAYPADYYTAAALDPAPTVASPRVLLRTIDRTFEPPHAWRTWKTVHWGPLVAAARTLWARLDFEQPKLDELWVLLDRLSRAGDEPIAIRCPSRSAAEALRVTLTHERRTPQQVTVWEQVAERVTVCRFRDRFPWGEGGIEILSGAPTPDAFSLLVGAEASAVHVLVYGPEAAALAGQSGRWATRVDQWRAAAATRLGTTRGARTEPPTLPLPVSAPRSFDVRRLELPNLSLDTVLARAAEAIDERDVELAGDRIATLGALRRLTPVHLVGGRTWWAPSAEQPVMTLTVSGERYVQVEDLQAGDEIIVPTGDGAESVHARLVAAVHRTADVATLDALLGQFRRAATAVLKQASTNQQAVERVREHGAQAAGQLPQWASGRTIAPENPGDVEAVFSAAGVPCPDLGILYEVANSLRGLHRLLGRLVAAVRSPDSAAAVASLTSLVGDVAEELVEEFAVARVECVGESVDAPASFAGRMAS